MEHEVRHEDRDVTSDVGQASVPDTSRGRPNSDTAMLQSFDEAIDRLTNVARDASALVVGNSESLAFLKARNDRLERLVAVNQARLDRLVGAQPA